MTRTFNYPLVKMKRPLGKQVRVSCKGQRLLSVAIGFCSSMPCLCSVVDRSIELGWRDLFLRPSLAFSSSAMQRTVAPKLYRSRRTVQRWYFSFSNTSQFSPDDDNNPHTHTRAQHGEGKWEGEGEGSCSDLSLFWVYHYRSIAGRFRRPYIQNPRTIAIS